MRDNVQTLITNYLKRHQYFKNKLQVTWSVKSRRIFLEKKSDHIGAFRRKSKTRISAPQANRLIVEVSVNLHFFMVFFIFC